MMDNLILFLQIILINIVLSGDNAVVIAMASKNLPAPQRKLAIWWGVFGAVALRLVLTAVAVVLLKVPFIQAAGCFLLMYIAVKLLLDEEGHANIKEAATLSSAVFAIIAADFVMSLDNVLAIAAIAKGDYALIILGIGLSIPLIIWGSQMIVRLLNRFPLLVFIGAAILGYTAGDMFVHDRKIRELLAQAHHSYEWVIPVFMTGVVVTVGLIKKLSSGRAAQS